MHDNLIYILYDYILYIELIKIHHDNSLIDYYNIIKIIELLSQNYYFPDIYIYIKKYISIYDLYFHDKISWYLKYNEFTSFSILFDFWKDIFYDFIINFLEFNKCNSILIFIDCFIKISHFISCNKIIIAPEFAYIFFNYIIHFHDIPDSIISDYRSIFISQFWKILSKSLDLKKRLSIFFHLQIDNQIEYMNQIIEQYLRIYYNYHQNDWLKLLSLIKFFYNNIQYINIDYFPFFVNYNYNSHFNIDLQYFSKHSIPVIQEKTEKFKILHENFIKLIKIIQNQ